MLRFVEPTVTLHDSWLAAHREWGPGQHEDGFGLFPSDEVESSSGFAAWIDRLEHENAADGSSTGTYRCFYRWIVDGEGVLGAIALRYGDDPFINAAGHIGYGMRPSERGKGIATWALGEMLDLARARGLERVLLVCEADNEPSAATIVRNAGFLEGVEATDDGPMSRYWIEL